MRKTVTLLLLLGLAGAARGHFVWLLPEKGGEQAVAQMVFSDALEPDENVPVQKIAQTKLFARAGARGESVPVKVAEGKHAYRVAVEGKGLVLIGGVTPYGVLSKGKGGPYLLMYYPKTAIKVSPLQQPPAWVFQGSPELALEIVPVEGKQPKQKVLFRGKPAAGVEVVLTVPGVEEKVERKTDADGLFELAEPKASGLYGVRAKLVEPKAGEHDGKKYQEVRHYATFTFPVLTRGKPGKREANESEISFVQPKDAKPAEDPAASRLLADARAARAVWKGFPGFTADVTVNRNGTVAKGRVDVSAAGKVQLDLNADEELKSAVRREIASLVAHRLPGAESLKTPAAFADEQDHPQGRKILILNDELHSSYRIRDRQILEVNRRMRDSRFTITVLENTWNKDKQYLPTAYVVNTWDLKTGDLKQSSSHHNTWATVGTYDLPHTVLTVTAGDGKLDSRQITFSGIALKK